MQERKYEPAGQHVIYVDSHGVPRDALITMWWSASEEQIKLYGVPGCNVVYVSGNEAKSDGYGRQTEHSTSVVHRSKQPAPGNYWRWPDESD